MDPIAHTLVGATLAETGLKRRTPLATATLVLGANVPDIDALTMFAGRDTSLLLRRGHTHGVLAMVVLPLVLTGVMLLWDRAVRLRRRPDATPVRAGPLLLLAVLSTLTHPLLDFMNTYGVRLLMPFDGRWFYGDALFIVDPWMWLLMAASVVLARTHTRPGKVTWLLLLLASTALVTLSDRAPLPAKLAWFAGVGAIFALRMRGAPPATVRRTAYLCLGTLAVYIGVMLATSALARSQARDWLAARDVITTEVMAGPIAANPFRRDVVAVTAEGYRFLEVRWLGDPRIRETDNPLPGDERDRIIEAALRAPSMRGFANWMRFPTYHVAKVEAGYRVAIDDVRYSRARSAIGSRVVLLDHALKPR